MNFHFNLLLTGPWNLKFFSSVKILNSVLRYVWLFRQSRSRHFTDKRHRLDQDTAFSDARPHFSLLHSALLFLCLVTESFVLTRQLTDQFLSVLDQSCEFAQCFVVSRYFHGRFLCRVAWVCALILWHFTFNCIFNCFQVFLVQLLSCFLHWTVLKRNLSLYKLKNLLISNLQQCFCNNALKFDKMI